MTTTLVIGFDSAWSGNNSGAIVGALRKDDGSYTHLGDPQIVDFKNATEQINKWQEESRSKTTLILIDQPTIVPNQNGQRPVENIVASLVSRRYGGVQPANRKKAELFGDHAPIWRFLHHEHQACLDPFSFTKGQSYTWVIETFPVLALITLDWLLDDNSLASRPTGRLPKYNPAHANFSKEDWQFVCKRVASRLKKILPQLGAWIDVATNNLPVSRREGKQMQDCLDACICLLVGLHLITGNDCLFVGDMQTGYMVVPSGNKQLGEELENRCNKTNREPSGWLRNFKIS